MKVFKTISLEDNPIYKSFEVSKEFEGTQEECKAYVLEQVKATKEEYSEYCECVSILNVDANEIVVMGYDIDNIDDAITTKFTIEA